MNRTRVYNSGQVSEHEIRSSRLGKRRGKHTRAHEPLTKFSQKWLLLYRDYSGSLYLDKEAVLASNKINAYSTTVNLRCVDIGGGALECFRKCESRPGAAFKSTAPVISAPYLDLQGCTITDVDCVEVHNFINMFILIIGVVAFRDIPGVI